MTMGFLQRMADLFVKSKKFGKDDTARVLNDFLRYVESNYTPHKKHPIDSK